MKIHLTLAGARKAPGASQKTETISVDEDITLATLKNIIHISTSIGLASSRQRLSVQLDDGTFKKLPINKDTSSLSDLGFNKNDTVNLIIKDLGPQISWRTVFLVEYLGPLLIHQILFFRALARQNINSHLQILGYACISLHFLKREWETFFVHRFSHATMPLMNLFKNCGHYWILSGFGIGIPLYSSRFEAVGSSTLSVALGVLLFVFGELGNLHAHMTLRDLRPPGTHTRAIPHSPLFRYISCPNYTMEIIAWIGVSLMSGLWMSWLFTVVAAVQMGVWARKKHANYKNEFGSKYPKSRKAMIPFIF